MKLDLLNNICYNVTIQSKMCKQGGIIMESQVKETNISIYPDGRMSTKSAAAYLGLSVKTLAMKRCLGTGPKFIRQGRIFYYKEDLDEWIILSQVYTYKK